MRVCVAETVVPFTRGGAELHVDGLVSALMSRGFGVERIRLPFAWHDREHLLESALAWRLLHLRAVDGGPVDAVIATRFPSYLIRHPVKVVWLIHQFRQAYDLDGTRFGYLSNTAQDRRIVEIIRSMDARGLGEARRLFANAANTAARLERFNGLTAQPLYPPPPMEGRYFSGDHGDFVLSVGRLDAIKRVDLLIEAVARSHRLRAVIVGDGPERRALDDLVRARGVADRVELLGRVSDDRLLDLYAGCGCVCYLPFDEDFGYVTLEAFRSAKAVVTVADSGGVTELVEDGETGLVAPRPAADEITPRLERLIADSELARRLGANGRARVAGIGWDQVIEALVGQPRA